MKKNSIIVVLLIVIFAIAWDISREDKQTNKNVYVTTIFGMDTFIDVKLYGEDNANQAIQEISKQILDFEQKMSMYVENGEIANVNASSGIEYVEVSEQTLDIISKAKKYSDLSKGAFDVTIAPITNLWKQDSQSPIVPTKSEIENNLKLVDYEDVLINYEDSQIMLKNKGQAIDLGAIAKGEFANIIFEILEEYNVENGYISIGGNMAVVGTKPDGTDFKFGIRDPQGSHNQYIGSVTIQGKTMATTGGYERYFEKDGEKYIHVIDPKTGYPVESDLLSVSVISSDGGLADYLSTTFFVMGKDIALENINNPQFDVVIVDNQNNIYISNGLEDVFEENKTDIPYKFKYMAE